MDIRSAKMQGNIPPRHVVEQNPTVNSADINEEGAPQVEQLEMYGGDPVIAGYMDYLGKNGINKDDIAAVLDSILTAGSVNWTFKLLDRIPVTYTVRPAWVDDYTAKTLDRLTAQNIHVSSVRYANTISECNLAASLIQYGEQKFNINNESDMDMARERIRKMPYMIMAALVKKLAVFDRVIACAMSDWAVANFTTPLKEKSGEN